jgi:hypothetical protein
MPKKFASIRVLLLATAALFVYQSGSAEEVSYCVPNGQWDDVLEETDCCSGYAEPGSTWCVNPGDYGTTWYSCYHLCAENPAPMCSPSCCNPPWECSCCDGASCPCY